MANNQYRLSSDEWELIRLGRAFGLDFKKAAGEVVRYSTEKANENGGGKGEKKAQVINWGSAFKGK